VRAVVDGGDGAGKRLVEWHAGRAQPPEGTFQRARPSERRVVLGAPVLQPRAQVVAAHPLRPREEHVGEQAVELVDRQAERVGGDDRVGPPGPDRAVGEHVGGEEVVEGAHGRAGGAAAAGREDPGEVRLQREHVDLVERHPLAAAIGQPAGGEGDPRREPLGCVDGEPELLAQPRRVGEVVQGHERLEAALTAGVEDRRIALEGGVVDGALGGFHARPLDRQPERVAAGGDGAIELLLVPVPEPEGVAAGLDPPGALPTAPVVRRPAGAVVAALDLEPRGGHAEAKSLGHAHADDPSERPKTRLWWSGIREGGRAMAKYLVVETRDPFDSNDVDDVYDLATGLADDSNDVTVFLVQNGVLPVRKKSAAAKRVAQLAKKVTVLTDDFSLRE